MPSRVFPVLKKKVIATLNCRQDKQIAPGTCATSGKQSWNQKKLWGRRNYGRYYAVVLLIGFPGPDPNYFFHRNLENFSIPHLSCLCRLHNKIDDFPGVFVLYHNL